MNYVRQFGVKPGSKVALAKVEASFTDITRTCKMLGRGSEALLGGKLATSPV